LAQLFAGASQRDFLAFEITQYSLDMRRGAVLDPITHGTILKTQLACSTKLAFEQIYQQFFNSGVAHA
jgi:hypothetical protein